MLLAGPLSHSSTQYIDFVEITNMSLHLSAVYFTHFSPLCIVVTLESG